MKDLKSRAAALVALWQGRLLPGWNIDLQFKTRAKMPGTRLDTEAQASEDAIVGERKARIWLNTSVSWKDAFWCDLEVTIVHELVHILIQDSGFEGALDAAMHDYGANLSVQAAVHRSRILSNLEVLIDTLAVALVTAYGRS